MDHVRGKCLVPHSFNNIKRHKRFDIAFIFFQFNDISKKYKHLFIVVVSHHSKTHSLSFLSFKFNIKYSAVLPEM